MQGLPQRYNPQAPTCAPGVLTKWACQRLTQGEPASGHFQPVVLLKDAKPIRNDASTDVRFKLKIGDCDHVISAVAVRSPDNPVAAQLAEGRSMKDTLIRIKQAHLMTVSGKRFVFIQSADSLGACPPELCGNFQLDCATQATQPTQSSQCTNPGSAFELAQQQQNAAMQHTAAMHQQPAVMQHQQPAAMQHSSAMQPPRFTSGFETPPKQPLDNPYAAAAGGGRDRPASFGAPSPPSFGLQPAATFNRGEPQGLANYGSGDIFGLTSRAPAPAFAGAAANPGGFLPVCELTPYASRKWRIKARVVVKYEIRKFSNSRGEGQLLKLDLRDKSGEICATLFGEAVDKYGAMLTQGQVYAFSEGSVKAANKRFDKGEFVVTFDQRSVIELAENDRDIPGMQWQITPLAEVTNMAADSYIDVGAVIVSVQEPLTFTSKGGKELTKRELHLWDGSGDGTSSLPLTLWGSTASRDDFREGAVLFVKSTRVSEFNSSATLNSGGSFDVDPNDPRCFQLKAKYNEQMRVRPIVVQPRMNMGGSGPRRTLEACKEEDLHLALNPGPGVPLDPNGPKSVHRHNVLVTLSPGPLDRPPCYPACSEIADPTKPAAERRACQKKASQEGDGQWRCAAGHCCEAPTYRYLWRVNAVDHTDGIEVTLFNEAAQKLLGVEAGEFNRLWEQDQQTGSNRAQAVAARAFWRRVQFRLRASKEIWQEAERTRYVGDVATEIDYSADARRMLAEMRSSLGGA